MRHDDRVRDRVHDKIWGRLKVPARRRARLEVPLRVWERADTCVWNSVYNHVWIVHETVSERVSAR